MNLLLRQGLRHHLHHPLQTALTILGIAAGVALLVAMRLGQGTAERAFDRALATVAGDATHTLTADPGGIPVAALVRVRELLHGRGVAPTVQALAHAGTPTAPLVLRVLGIDPFAEAEVRGWLAPSTHGASPVAALTTTPGGFLATADLLAHAGWAAGQAVSLRLGARTVTAHCLGALTAPPGVAAGLGDVLVVDIATAQEWTGRLTTVDRLELRVADPEQAAAALAACGPAARLEPAGAQHGGLAALAKGFRTNLTALCLLSLLVGAFLAHETMRLSVVARRSGFGVLRALGAHGPALGAAVLGEALLLGAVGSTLGVLLGVVAADALLAPIVRTLNFHYATFALDVVEVQAGELLLGGAVGVMATLLAALAPAFAAARVAPREVLVPQPSRGGRAWPTWWCVPPALLGVGLLATVGDRLVQAYLALLCLLLAAVATTPLLMTTLLGAVGGLWRRAGPFARYVVRSTAAAEGHLALPLAAMALAVAATIGMAILMTSFRSSVAGWLDQVLPGDVYVSVPGGKDEQDQPIGAALVAELSGMPEVASATVYRRSRCWMRAGTHQGRIDLVAVRPTANFRNRFPLLEGDRQALDRGAGVWISEPLAFRWQLALGDALEIATNRGAEAVQIAGIYRDYSNERGEVLVGEAWAADRVELPVTALGLELRSGIDVGTAQQHAQRTIAAATDAAVQARAQPALRASSLAVFDQTFAITGIMRLLCLGVAFVGIYAGFSALQLERSREVGVLRCLGARPGQVARVVVGQTALLGLCAAALALPLGIGIGQLLVRVINRVSFGWRLVEIQVPWLAVGEALGLAMIAALLAGVQPAWQFARLRPAQNLREA